MKCSFIIPSLGRQKELQKCLSSIINSYEYINNRVEIEILVVINGGNCDSSFLDIKYPEITEIYTLKEKGNSRARNYGIKKSRGDYLFFLDDDAFVREDFIKVLFENIKKNEAQAFCGRLLNPQDNSPFTKVYRNDTSKYLYHFDYHYLGGTELVIKREIIERIGFFDENFGPGAKYYAAEQTDLFFSLLRANIKVKYVPELIIFHPVVNDTPPEKVYYYSYGMGAALIKHLFSEYRSFFIYFLIILNILLRSALRSLQIMLFPRSIRCINNRFRFFDVFRGTLLGMVGYLKYR